MRGHKKRISRLQNLLNHNINQYLKILTITESKETPNEGADFGLRPEGT
jgi:hypothetical protein